ncbi:MAG: hypothetical protein ABFD25_03280 [Clostridiaceae bacterium]
MINDVKDHIFHNASAATGNGKFLEAGYFKTLTVEIFSSAANSARTVTFYSKGPSGVLKALAGVRVSAAPFVTAVNTTGTDETWQFDISGLHKVYMDLTAITDGTVSVYGRAVS